MPHVRESRRDIAEEIVIAKVRAALIAAGDDIIPGEESYMDQGNEAIMAYSPEGTFIVSVRRLSSNTLKIFHEEA